MSSVFVYRVMLSVVGHYVYVVWRLVLFLCVLVVVCRALFVVRCVLKVVVVTCLSVLFVIVRCEF